MRDFCRAWIITQGVPIVRQYGGNLTLRSLYYRLVALGMPNDLNHYKRVVGAMGEARWDGRLGFDAFLDHERGTLGATAWEPTDVPGAVAVAEEQIRTWATSYHKHMWENQAVYPEVFIEKKALQGAFQDPCSSLHVALNPCKGYPSITFLYDAAVRFELARRAGKRPVLLYFGDYDPTGEDIPRSVEVNLRRLGVRDVEVRRVALLESQVVDWDLPPATKDADVRSRNWEGLGQVELDAVEPDKLTDLCRDAITDLLDPTRLDDLRAVESRERRVFTATLAADFKSLLDEDEDEEQPYWEGWDD
jgi:hypothetical protein